MSFFYLFFGVIIVCLIGLPLAFKLCYTKKDLQPKICKIKLWALTPFMGYGIIVGVTKLLLITNLPVKYTAWIAIAFFAGMYYFFFNYLRKNKIAITNIIPPKSFLITSFIILTLVSIPYFVLGPLEYKLSNATDLAYYQSNAEMLRVYPLKEINVSEPNNSIIDYGKLFFAGRHRISLGLFQAFVSTLMFTDVASITGFTGAFCVFAVFCAILYVAKTIKLKTNHYLVAFFVAMTPCVVSSMLECFLPVVLYSAFQIISIMLIAKAFEKLDFVDTIIVAIFVSATFTTLLESFFPITGIAFLMLVIMLLSNKTKIFAFVHGIALAVSIAILNFPIITYVFAELFDDNYKTREFLNGLFPHSYSKIITTKLFWGISSGITTLPSKINLLLSVLALLLFCVGIYGIISVFIKKRLDIGLGLISIVLMPIIFYAKDTDCSYAIYKLVIFAFPLIALGVFVFWDEVKEFIDTHWRFNKDDDKDNKIKNIVKKLGFFALSAIFVFSTSVSVFKCVNIIVMKDSIFDATYYALNCSKSEKTNEVFMQLKQEKNKNILVLLTHDYALNTWMAYYGGSNNIYNLYLNKEIPDDVKIYRSARNFTDVKDERFKDDFTIALYYDINNNPESPYFKPADKLNLATGSQFVLNSFARFTKNATLKISIKDFIGTEVLIYNDIEFTCNEQGNIEIPIEMTKGVNEYKIKVLNQENITISEYELIF